MANRSMPASVVVPVLMYPDVPAAVDWLTAAFGLVERVRIERQYTAEDLAGHRWTFTQTVADVDPREWGGVVVEPGSRSAQETLG